MSDTPRARRVGRGDDAPTLTFSVDGEPIAAHPGETIAVALLLAGRRILGHTARRGEPRGLYCVMGVCWECAVVVDGRTARACLEPVRPGLEVLTRRGPRP